MIKIVAYTKVLACIIFLTIVCNLLVGQPPKIRVLGGANVGFNFNTYNRIQNGITYNDFTKLELNSNGTPAPNGWELTVRALQANIGGSMTTYFLPVESIKVKAKKDGVEYTSYDLGTGEQTIISGPETTLDKVIVEISYSCGTDSDPNYKMINKVPDYYAVDIEFTLRLKQ
ncbi:MAG TPA: hypothetical protein PLS84_00780 [Salinivirgaceae bacterium]|nr:hypothetical protein [Salinivirgaceae bacterium]